MALRKLEEGTRLTTRTFFLLAALAGWSVAPAVARSTVSSPPPPVAVRTRPAEALDRLALYFVENRGQANAAVGYYLQGVDKTVYFTSRGLTFILTGRSELGPKTQNASLGASGSSSAVEMAPTELFALRLDFLGADPAARPRGEEPTPAVVSYFKGPRNRWRTGLTTYSRLVYRDLWPGIDLVYSGTVNRMKYTFEVRPWADPRRIRLAYRGSSELAISPSGELVVTTPMGRLRDERPVSFQQKAGRRMEVPTSYRLEPAGTTEERAYGFALGDYDPSLPLVVDPAMLVYAGFLGGSGSEGGRAIAVDGAGNVYVTGVTTSTEATFPDGDGFGTVSGADGSFNGDNDAFVAKVSADGSALVYAGYLGGSAFDSGNAIAVDAAGNAYVAGSTVSEQATFPDGNGFGTLGGPDSSFNGGLFDAFVAKVNAAGTSLLYAGYLGGGGFETAFGIAVDSAGNAYVTGFTDSTEDSFPDGDGIGGIPGSDVTYNGGGGDAYVVKVNAAGSGLLYASYVGGGNFDAGRGIAVDEAGNAYLVGRADSSQATFPDGDGFGSVGGMDVTHNGDSDGFLAKVNAPGTALLYASYLGGSGTDQCNGIALGRAGEVYVTGDTGSTHVSFPDGDGVGTLASPDATYNGGPSDAFVAKVNAAGTALLYAGYLGGSGDDRGNGIGVDGAGNTYVTGTTSSSEVSFPDGDGFGGVNGADVSFNGGAADAFVVKVSPAGTGLLYATYLGGSGVDTGAGIAVRSGNAYVTGSTESPQATFPDGDGLGSLPGPDATFNGGTDAFVAKIGSPVPPFATWLTTESLPGLRFQVRIGGNRAGVKENDCIAETLCVSGAKPGRSEVFVRVIGPRPNGFLWPHVVKFTTSLVEVWIEQTSTGILQYYRLAAADPEGGVLDGLFDRLAFSPAPPGLRETLTGAAVGLPPPSSSWLTTAALPGFRFQVRISGNRTGVKESDCLAETLCVSGAVAGRSEVFVRIIGPRPNGYLWPNVVKFTTSRIEVWIEQTKTHQVQYYNLAAADPDAGILAGLFDRTGFLP